ncbi:F0F1 ATP synthase subunit B [bacterium]|jgi:F-type H+-transporting ATPase subunit b|nr:F0F1 ATP synthase subunit B [Flavobacteriales bacterium]MDB3870374.1 F0F1 ATP synthase subunit B [bacterium]
MDKLINDFSVGLFFWQSVLFIALILLLKKFAWGPILTAVEEREDGIKNALEAAEKAKAEMQALNADNERILAEARIERDALLKEAREIKDGIVNDAKELANTEADKILTTAKDQINNEKMKAMTELKNTVATLSIDIAEKVLRSELTDKKKQEDLVANALKETEPN